MKYTVEVAYKDGIVNTWEVSDWNTAFFILTKEYRQYGKAITRAFLKGVRL